MPGFLSSNLYYKYLSDLINSVRADEFVSTSTPAGQGGPSDGDRGPSSEGSQAQVSPTPPPTWGRGGGGRGVTFSNRRLDHVRLNVTAKGLGQRGQRSF